MTEMVGPRELVAANGWIDERAVTLESLLAMRRAGGRTIAQDEATSTVYGMPRAAADMGAAENILPLPRIAERALSAAGLQ